MTSVIFLLSIVLLFFIASVGRKNPVAALAFFGTLISIFSSSSVTVKSAIVFYYLFASSAEISISDYPTVNKGALNSPPVIFVLGWRNSDWAGSGLAVAGVSGWDTTISSFWAAPAELPLSSTKLLLLLELDNDTLFFPLLTGDPVFLDIVREDEEPRLLFELAFDPWANLAEGPYPTF